MSKSRFRDPSEQGFLRFSELGSPDYIVKTTIFSVWVFLLVSVHGNTLYAIAIHKNRSITPFLTLWSHFENWTKNLLSLLQLLRTCHMGFWFLPWLTWKPANSKLAITLLSARSIMRARPMNAVGTMTIRPPSIHSSWPLITPHLLFPSPRTFDHHLLRNGCFIFSTNMILIKNFCFPFWNFHFGQKRLLQIFQWIWFWSKALVFHFGIFISVQKSLYWSSISCWMTVTEGNVILQIKWEKFSRGTGFRLKI